MSSFGCPLCCHQKFDSILALREHLLYFTYRPLICVLCSMTIGGIYELTHHLETHLNTDKSSSLYKLKANVNPDTKLNYFSSGTDGSSIFQSHYTNFSVDEDANYNGAFHFKRSCDEQKIPLTDQYEVQEKASTSGESRSYTRKNSSSPKLLSDTKTCITQSLLKSYEKRPSVVLNSCNSMERNVNCQVLPHIHSSTSSNSEVSSLNVKMVSSQICSHNKNESNSLEVEDFSRQRTECSICHGDNGEPVRAFACKVCGLKIVGKEFYFKHLQEKCELSKRDLVETRRKEVSCEVYVLNNNSSNNKNKIPTILEDKIVIPEENMLSGKELEGSVIYMELKNAPSLKRVAAQEHEYNRVPQKKKDTRELSRTELSENANPTEKINTSVFNKNVPALNTDTTTISTIKNEIPSSQVGPAFKNDGVTNLKSPSQPYIHKKFDHDQDRKTCKVTSKDDVQCYIQNFQSLLVNKLNQAFETSLIKSPPCDEGVAEEEINTEEKSSFPNTNETLDSSNSSIEDPPEITAKYDCRYCSKSFVWKKSRDIHERSHSCRNIVKCKYCHKVFTKPVLLYRHQQELHSTLTFFCNLCGRHFRSRRTLSNHKGIHEKKQFGCTKCSYVCHTGSGLRTHTYEAHSHKLKEISCSHCGEKFKKKYGLKRHLERKHKTENHSCRYCDKGFHCKEDLTHHLNTHLNNKSLSCSICNKVFTTISSLKRHSVRHKQEANVFKCDKCSSSFTRKDSLLSHIKLHTSTRRYICKCGKGFLKQSQLKYHAVKHSDESRFRCELCQKAYKFKVSLKNHNCKVKPKVSLYTSTKPP